MTSARSLAGQRTVVTGAAGFIGSHLATALLRCGATVTGIDWRVPQRDRTAAANLTDLIETPSFRYVVADLRTAPLAEHLRDVDVVFHLAAIPGVRASWGPQFQDYASCNVLATQRIMEAVTQLRVSRVVVASSSSVYGATDGSPSKESDLLRPASPYGVTKLAAEQLCLAYAARSGSPTSAVALRYFSVFGPRQRQDMFIHRALTAAMTGKPVRLFGDGRQRRDFTFVEDVVAATIAAATADLPNTVINIGAGVGATLLDALDIIHQLTGQPIPVEIINNQDGDVQATLADSAAAQHLLHWRPTVGLAEGISKQLSSLAPTLASSTHAADAQASTGSRQAERAV